MRIIVEGELGSKAKLFKPLMFRSQVVRGIHYIIKVCNLVLQNLGLRSLAGQTLLRGERVWSNSHHHLVSNTPRISN